MPRGETCGERLAATPAHAVASRRWSLPGALPGRRKSGTDDAEDLGRAWRAAVRAQLLLVVAIAPQWHSSHIAAEPYPLLPNRHNLCCLPRGYGVQHISKTIYGYECAELRRRCARRGRAPAGRALPSQENEALGQRGVLSTTEMKCRRHVWRILKGRQSEGFGSCSAMQLAGFESLLAPI